MRSSKKKRQRAKCLVHSESACSSVGGDGLVDPAPEFGHAGEHGRVVWVAVADNPGGDSYQGPHPVLLTHQRTTGVSLEKTHSHNL